MKRRAFLSVAAGGVLASGVSRGEVVIAGSGMAGLSCGWELRKRGYEVLILEGQGRAGGRVETLREGLAPGVTAETGATRIPDTHELTLAYVREFGLALEPFRPGWTLADVFHLRGKNYALHDGKEPEWALDLRPEVSGRMIVAHGSGSNTTAAARPFAGTMPFVHFLFP